jgi:hypothetical protein
MKRTANVPDTAQPEECSSQVKGHPFVPTIMTKLFFQFLKDIRTPNEVGVASVWHDNCCP